MYLCVHALLLVEKSSNYLSQGVCPHDKIINLIQITRGSEDDKRISKGSTLAQLLRTLKFHLLVSFLKQIQTESTYNPYL